MSRLFLIVFLIVGAVSFSLFVSEKNEEKRYPMTVVMNGIEYDLEIADNDEERRKGLGGRDSLCERCAMLFVFEKPDAYGFWMQGMRFPIDIVWLSGERVVTVIRDIPSDSSEVYFPKESADRVLEFNTGMTTGLKEGDRVEFK